MAKSLAHFKAIHVQCAWMFILQWKHHEKVIVFFLVICKPKIQSTLLTVLAHHATHAKGENWKLKGWGMGSQMSNFEPKLKIPVQCFLFFLGEGGERSVCFKL